MNRLDDNGFQAGYAECIKGPLKKELCKGLDALELKPSAGQVSQLCKYLEQLLRWNKVYNLTAVRRIEDMLIQHMFDCLAIVKPLREQFNAPVRVLDVGSGAGLPAVVIAVLNPGWEVVAVDAAQKKMAFVQQQASSLGINNLHAKHARVEELKAPEYDLIISRAFSSLKDFVDLTKKALRVDGVWCAMKGRLPAEEIDALGDGVDVFHVKHIQVPQMTAERCLVWIRSPHCHT